jgi:hypothetical protein
MPQLGLRLIRRWRSCGAARRARCRRADHPLGDPQPRPSVTNHLRVGLTRSPFLGWDWITIQASFVRPEGKRFHRRTATCRDSDCRTLRSPNLGGALRRHTPYASHDCCERSRSILHTGQVARHNEAMDFIAALSRHYLHSLRHAVRPCAQARPVVIKRLKVEADNDRYFTDIGQTKFPPQAGQNSGRARR